MLSSYLVKIATFNANSIRVRLEIVLDWLAHHQPDVLAIQETKVEDDKFPHEAFEESGYNVAFHGQKTYNGVAIASLHPIQNVRTGFGDPAFAEDCRVMLAEVDGVTIVNTYVPNGTSVGSEKFAYKLAWLKRFRQLCDARLSQAAPVVWLGDINIAPEPDDVYDSPKLLGGVGHHPSEFAALKEVAEWGWVDCFRKFTQGPGHYTYWDFVIPNSVKRGLGWRIDHIYASPTYAGKCVGCTIDLAPRLLDRPSDHTFVIAEFT